MTEVACVHRQRREAVTEDGQVLPITNMIDRFGDDTDDVDDAVTCVAGPDRDGRWLTIVFDQFTSAAVQ